MQVELSRNRAGQSRAPGNAPALGFAKGGQNPKQGKHTFRGTINSYETKHVTVKLYLDSTAFPIPYCDS